MRVGIIGAGNIGRTLARHLVRLGHRVSLANSRGPDTLRTLAAGMGASAASVLEAAQTADLVIVTIPQKAILELPPTLFHDVPDSVPVVDTGNYYPQLRDGRIAAIDAGMPDSVWVAKQLRRPIIKAFNHVYARTLLEKGLPPRSVGRVALAVAGDSLAARGVVQGLVDALGFDPLEGGLLSESWRQQPGTPAYCRDLGKDELSQALTAADPARVEQYRAEQEGRTMSRLDLAVLPV